jgi:acetyl esterase/lipase
VRRNDSRAPVQLPLMRAMRALIRVRRRMRGPMRPSWDEKLETWARFLHHYGKRSTLLPLSFQRRMLGIAPATPLTRSMRFEKVNAGGVPSEWFRGPNADDTRVMLHLHGGGYSLGSIDSSRT